MTFRIYLLFAFVLIGRPQDLFRFLTQFRPALLLMLLTTVFVFSSTSQKELKGVFRISEARAYTYFFIIMLIGIPFAYHRRYAFDGAVTGYIVNILFFYISVLLVNNVTRMKALLTVVLISSFFYSVFSLAFGMFAEGRFTTYGAMYDSNDIAYVLITLLPVPIFFILRNDGRIKKGLAISALSVSLIVILLTGSRAGLIGLGGALFLLIFTSNRSFKPSYKLVFLALIVVVVILYSGKINVDRYLTLTNISSDYNIDTEFGRMKIWERSWQLLLRNPFTGVGTNCSPAAIGYLREELGLIPRWQVVHNSYLQVAVEVGLIGFGFFAYLIYKAFNRFFTIKNLRAPSGEAEDLSAIAGLLMIGFFGHLITAAFLTQGYSIFFTMFFAFSAILGRLRHEVAVKVKAKDGLAEGFQDNKLVPGSG